MDTMCQEGAKEGGIHSKEERIYWEQFLYYIFLFHFASPFFLKSHCNNYKQQIFQKYWRSPVFMPMVRPA